VCRRIRRKYGLAEGQVEEKEEGEGDEFAGEDVQRPGPEVVEERWGGRLVAEEHVVGLEGEVEGADDECVDVGGDERAGDGAGAGAELPRPDEVERRADDEPVVDEELDREERRGIDQIGSEEGLGGSGDGPVVGDVEDGAVEGEERGDDEPEGGVAELEGDVVGKHGRTCSGEVRVKGDGSCCREEREDVARESMAGTLRAVGDGE